MADKNCSMCGGKGYYCEHSTVETCWCVKPTAEDDVIEIKAEAERTKDLARIANMLREDAEVFSSCDYEVEHYDKAADGIEWLIAEVERLRGQAATYTDLRLEVSRLKAENEVLRGALQAVQAEVDGNLRPLTRDLVNMVSGLNNGTHPNDIYDHCDEIERAIGAALEGAKP
ncbi:hypothetical protein ACM7EK_30340 [Pseudomonas aeruginosa]|nr:hypothetical protein [Pseudomonas aeruginosa]